MSASRLPIHDFISWSLFSSGVIGSAGGSPVGVSGGKVGDSGGSGITGSCPVGSVGGVSVGSGIGFLSFVVGANKKWAK